MWLLWIGLNHGQNLYLIHKIGAIYKFLSFLCIFKVIDWRQIGRILATFATRQKYNRNRREATQCRARNCSTLQRVTHLTFENYGKSFINLLYTEPAKMQKAPLSNKARWSRNRVHPFQAVSHSKRGGKMNGSLCNLCAKRKNDCHAHDRKSCFSVPSSGCEVQTRSLQEGWLFERVVDHGSFVRLDDLPSTTAEQHIPLEKPVLQAPTPLSSTDCEYASECFPSIVIWSLGETKLRLPLQSVQQWQSHKPKYKINKFAPLWSVDTCCDPPVCA